MFGGKLAWGPDAIVRDDPNFHGRGNISSGNFLTVFVVEYIVFAMTHLICKVCAVVESLRVEQRRFVVVVARENLR